MSGRLAVDTNVLVRFMLRDDEVQALEAGALLASADMVVVSNVTFAELVWVMRKIYRISRSDVAAGLRVLIEAGTLEFDRAAVAAGLAMLDKGGDFADGVLHYEASRGKAAIFATFDRRLAARLPAEQVVLLGRGDACHGADLP